MARRLVIGDMHGSWKAFQQCLDRCEFNPDQDHLICLGDVTDGWPETRECIEHLMSLPNLTILKGNHDAFTIKWAQTGIPPPGWQAQGGYATIESYAGMIYDKHLAFLEGAEIYHTMDNMLFAHAGFQIDKPLENQPKDTFLWDRTLFRQAFPYRNDQKPPKLTQFDAIFIGHSPVHRYGYLHPVNACEVWMMDTGAGWNGVLSIMDIDSKQYWTSDQTNTLYPDHKGRFI